MKYKVVISKTNKTFPIKGLNELEENEMKYKVAIILTVFTGVRLGELMGLDWENIDFKNKEITVNKSSQYLASTGVYTKPPKTPSSFRHISIPDSVIEILEEYKIWYDSQKEGEVVYIGKVAYAYKGTMPANTGILFHAPQEVCLDKGPP